MLRSYILVVATLFALVFSGCSGGGSGSSSDGGVPDSSVSSVTISGYAEDDPIPDANVSLYDDSGNIIKTAKTDENGLYNLDAALEKDAVYYLKVVGVLYSKEITMNSILNFDGNNTTVHTNPLTELKYQLVKNNGKSIDEAEALIREYFNISNGQSLENNRFSTTDTAYIGMKSVAEIYNGTLPVDAIAKIKEDIIANASHDTNQTKDFAFRSLVKKEIELDVSSTSLALGESVTVSISGIDELNENFTLKWTGLADDVNGTDLSKTFTINDFAQDVYVGTSLYKVDGNTSTLVSSASAVVNFYKELEEQHLTVTDNSVDNNFTAGENLNITIPAGVVGSGETIKIVEQQTNSDTSVAQFSIDAGSATDGNITFSYKYDPYLVSDPRSLQITMQTESGPKVLNVSEIDYVNHIVKFDLVISQTISRSASDHRYRVIIDLLKKVPTADDAETLYVRYMSYIEKILAHTNSNNNALDSLKTNQILTNIKGNLGKEKFIALMQKKYEKDGVSEYNYDLLATAINYIIAADSAELMFNSNVSWAEAKDASYNYKNNNCRTNNQTTSTLPYCSDLKKLYEDKLKEADKVLSAWVGNAKLTPGQTSFLKIAKMITNQAIILKSWEGTPQFVTTKLGQPNARYEILKNNLIGLTDGEINAIVDANADEDMTGYYVQSLTNSIAMILNGSLKFNFTNLAVGFAVNRTFDILKYNLTASNRNATFPLILGISKDYTKLNYSNAKMTMADGFTKTEFLNFAFPDGLTGMENTYRDYILNAPDYYLNTDNNSIGQSRLSSSLDPNKRFERAFLKMDTLFTLPIPDYDSTNDCNYNPGPGCVLYPTSNPYESYHNSGNLLNPYERAFVYTGFRYMYGDTEAKKQFDYLLDGSIMIAKSILFAVNEISKEDVVDNFSLLTGEGSLLGGNAGDIRIKSNLDSSLFQEFKNKWFNIWYSYSTPKINNFKNVSSYQTLMETAKLKLTNAQLEALNIKKIKVETYGVGLQYDSNDNAWTINESDKVNDTFEATRNINDMFTYDSSLGKNVLSFATLFSNENFTQFDDKLVGLKITLVFEKDGRDKVLSSDFVFTTLSDTENLIDTNFTGATLISNVKDASTNEPIQGAFVTVTPGGLSSLTDTNGNYEVSNLAAGEYTIIISKEGYAQIEAAVTLEEDETKVYEASLSIGDDQANDYGTSTVTIKDAFSGNVLTDGYIKVRAGQNNNNGEVIEEYNSDGNSAVEVSLFPGTYTIEAGANGYTKAYTTVTILGNSNENKTISISPVLSADQTRSVLSWGETPRDLDSHLVKKVDGEEQYHIYYGNRNPSSADANLDTDVTSGYGPETVTINNIDANAVYTYYVYNFSGGEGSVLPNSGAKVDVYFGDNSRTFYVPNEEGRYWKVFEIVNGDIVPCTSNCIADDTNTLIRNLNRNSNEFDIFKNLPAKQ
ncbi:carboxypeptidase regulatory-like domain-containing protein [bacterium]|nr:carboxypeptidase regulatory-like domain-containing protein [bacterium]MBU1993758.1 carboxypeptidase regulatory-like domain-containing protein [bacterium]